MFHLYGNLINPEIFYGTNLCRLTRFHCVCMEQNFATFMLFGLLKTLVLWKMYQIIFTNCDVINYIYTFLQLLKYIYYA